MHQEDNTPSVLIEDFSKRILCLEQGQYNILPIVGKMQEVANTFETIRDDLKEIKEDVKGISCAQTTAALDSLAIKNQVKILEDERLARIDRRKTIRNVIFTAGGTVLAALVIYLLKIR